MLKFILATLGLLLALCTLTVASSMLLPVNVTAEYWVRPLILEKEAIAASKPTPRIILLGGSSTLFGIDASAVERATGVSTVNFGLHGSLPLTRLLREANRVTSRGDLLVMPLESNYYKCEALDWSPWALRNALAWDRADFGTLPILEQLRAAFTGGSPELLFQQWIALVRHESYAAREEALKTPDQVLLDWRSGANAPATFEYSQFNLDPNGDMMHTEANLGHFLGLTGLEDARICPGVGDVLSRFVKEQHARGVTVAVAHHPYLIDGIPEPAWPAAETGFKSQIESTGATLIDDRSNLFFPPEAFFNMNGHLTAAARAQRTAQLILDLQSRNLVPKKAATRATERP